MKAALFAIALVIGMLAAVYTYVPLHHDTLTQSSPWSTARQARDTPESALSTQYSMPVIGVDRAGHGAVGTVTLTTAPGSGRVFVATTPYVDPSLQESVNTAERYALTATHAQNGTDFFYSYSVGASELLGGGSGGAAAAILTEAELQNRPIKTDAAITGAVDENGNVLPVGGLDAKLQAAGEAGYKYFLVPKGQKQMTSYVPQVTRREIPGGVVVTETYAQKSVDLQQLANQYNMTVVEVATVKDALPYFVD